MHNRQQLVYDIFDESITEDELKIHDQITGTKTFGQSGGITAELEVKDPNFYDQLLRYKSLGLADAFINGGIKTENLSALTAVMVKNRLKEAVKSSPWLMAKVFLAEIQNRPFNVRRAKKNTEHYNFSNDFYSHWLDPTMTYTSGIAPDENPDASLEEMQFHKHDLICRKLDLQPGDRLLDVGCGWGAMLRHAAKHYGVRATGITISTEQRKLALHMNEEQGLARNIEIELEDYRTFNPSQKFDKFVSIEMFEAVGKGGITPYMNMLPRVLKPEGLGLIQTITTLNGKRSDPFIERDIFPGGYLYKCFEIIKALEKRGYRCIDFEDFKQHYAKTLHCWDNNLTAAEADILTLGGKYTEQELRKWHMYLCYCKAGLKHGEPGLHQFLITANKAYQKPMSF